MKNSHNFKKLLLIVLTILFSVFVKAQTYTFTNAGATGIDGPTQSQINTAYSSTSLAGQVISVNGIQNWIVPVGGNYKIEVYGAEGFGTFAGKGAYMSGTFTLAASDTLKILVGQQGGCCVGSGTNQFGGGGGSFVVTPNNIPLIIAGGGGGAIYNTAILPSSNGSTGINGQSANGTTIGAGGINGNGGVEGGGGGGGGGFFTDGTTQPWGGKSFLNGGQGGLTTGSGGRGGFGGGAGCNSFNNGRGGGGGGYSGGGGAGSSTSAQQVGGGGGSYNIGSSQVNLAGVRSGHGLVVITLLSPPVPNNAGVSSITPLGNFCTGVQNIRATIRNFGSNAIDSVNVSWSVNNVFQSTITHNTTLDTSNGLGVNTALINLGTFNFTQSIPYTIKVWTSMPNGVADTVNFNDTMSVTVRPSLNGNYTINTAQVTGGTNFQNLTDAINALANFGVCGPVILEVDSNLFGSVTIPAIPGMDSINTLTIRGKGYTINSTTGPVIAFSQARFVTLDSLNVTLNATTGFGIYLGNQSRNISIRNSIINVGTTSTATSNGGIVASGSQTVITTTGANANNITIENNTIIGGYYGVSLVGTGTYLGSSGHIVRNNTFLDNYFGGVYLSSTDTVLVENNNISRATRTTISTYYGIYGTTTRNTKVIRNRIHSTGIGSYTCYPIWFATSINSVGFETQIINNSIWNIPSTSIVYGLYFSGSTTGFKINHNTVTLNTTGGTGAVRAAFFAVAPNNVDFRNNIMRVYGSGTGIKYSVYVTTTSTTFLSYNNVLNMAATAGTTNSVGFWTADRPTLADWTTASTRDTNSFNINPVFFDEPNGVLLPMNSVVDNKGTPVGILTDITNATRSSTTPDIGSVEFVGVNADLVLLNPQLIYGIGCNNTTDTLRVTLRNAIGSAVDFSVNPVTINWRLTGPIVDSGVFTITTGTLNSGSDLVITLSDSIDRTIAGTYQLKAHIPTSLVNNLSINDTVTLTALPAYSGVMNIGSVSFPTIQSAIDSLMLRGVCGAVTINLPPNSGPYNGNMVIGNIQGKTSSKSITINGNGNLLQSTTSPIVSFNNASFVTIDSLNLLLNATTGFGIHLGNQSSDIKITKCNINVGTVATVTTNAGIVVSGSLTTATTAGNNAQRVTIENNIINGGYYSIIMNGNATYLNNSGHVIRNNKLLNQFYYGIFITNTDTLLIEKNEIIRNAGRADVTSIYYGIYVVNGRNVNISSNRVHSSGAGSTSSTYGIGMSTSQNLTGARSRIINNAVYNMQTTGAGLVYGLHLLGTLDGIDIFHNTIEIAGNSSTGARRGINFATAPNNINLRNNIVSLGGTGTGSKYCIYATVTSTTFSSNNNVLYMGATGGTVNNTGFWTSDRLTLTDWRTATLQDSLSVNVNPVFANLANGDITPLSINADNIGALVGVTNDLNDSLRSTTTPDPGALEFTGIPGDLSMISASLKRVSQCYGFNDSVFVTIRNVIGGTVNFSIDPLTIVYVVTGPVNTTDSILISTGTLDVNSNLLVFNNNINMSVPGIYSLRAYIRPNAVNNSLINDSTNGGTLEVRSILSVTPKTGTATTPIDTFMLEARSPIFASGGVKITEVCHYKLNNTTPPGAPTTGWPSYLLADDYIELIGVPNSDLAGYTLEEWNGTTLQHTAIFPTGTLFSPNGTMVVATGQLGSSVPVPASFYYHSGNTTTHGSGDNRGYLIKNPSGVIIDAVVYGTYTFPTLSGVTSSDWTGSTANTSSAGNRLTGPDNNTSSNWVNSTIVPQDPNVLNAGVPLPTPASMAGFNWYFMGSPIDTNARIKVGPYTTPGIYRYVAEYVNSCGTFYDTVTITATSTVPVTLTSFDAVKNNNDVMLNWVTASEINNDYFEVQRSTDGMNFEKIGQVEGNGTTTSVSSYAFADKNVLAEFSSVSAFYYRLKQVDFDGTTDYSKTIRVSNNVLTSGNIEVYPNPNNGTFNITLPANEQSTIQLTIIDRTGKIVEQKMMQLQQGDNLLDLNLSLPKGIYMILIQQNGISVSKKFAVE
jgi:parallel beta-helix repeat protein